MSNVNSQSVVKARQLLHDLEQYNKTTVDAISTQIDKIESIDKEFQNLVKPLKNDALQAEAQRRLDLKLWPLDPLPTEKLAKHAQ